MGIAVAAPAHAEALPYQAWPPVTVERQVSVRDLLKLDANDAAQRIAGVPGALPAWEVNTLETTAGRVQIVGSGFRMLPSDPTRVVWCDLPNGYPGRVRYWVFVEGGLAAMVPPDPHSSDAPVSPADQAARVSRGVGAMKRAAATGTSTVLNYYCRGSLRGAFATPEHFLKRWARASGTALFQRLKIGEPLSANDRRFIARGGDAWLGDRATETRSADGRYEVVTIRLDPPPWHIEGGWSDEYGVGLLDGRVVWKTHGALAARVARNLSEGAVYSLP